MSNRVAEHFYNARQQRRDALSLTFDIGDAAAPRGHAIAYFRSGADILATYVLVLPISMDMGKYLPPLLASQLGGMAGDLMGGGMSSFAAPPVPEKVESIDYLDRLARARGDDLIAGGSIGLGDVAAAMNEAAQVVQEYNSLYEQSGGSQAAIPQPAAPQGDLRNLDESRADEGGAPVEHVLFSLMNDRDKLGELSKLVGTMRFATERSDDALIEETDASIAALEGLLPERYWADKVRAAAKDASLNGGTLAQLYVERCYKLIDEDFSAVEVIEKKITDLD
jgi:hypothetical protein